MSKFDYDVSKKIAAQDYPFYALVMAAMRQADTDNMRLLTAAFPSTWEELTARYNAPGGFLPGEGPKCTQCGQEMNPVNAMLSRDNGGVCGDCCRKNQEEVTR